MRRTPEELLPAVREPQGKRWLNLVERGIRATREILDPRVTAEKTLMRLQTEWKRCSREEVLPELKNMGLLGARPLEALPTIQRGLYGDARGETRGSFFLFMGSVEGKFEGQVRTASSIQFCWKPDKRRKDLVISEIPVDRLKIIISTRLKKPTIRFSFNHGKLMKGEGDILGNHYHCHALRLDHPNSYLRHEAFEGAVLTVEETAYKELARFLPLPSKT